MSYADAKYDEPQTMRVQSLAEHIENLEQRYHALIERLEKLEVQAGNFGKEINRLSDRVG